MMYAIAYFLAGMLLVTRLLVWARNWGGDTWANRPAAMPVFVFVWLPMILLGSLVLCMAALLPLTQRERNGYE